MRRRKTPAGGVDQIGVYAFRFGKDQQEGLVAAQIVKHASEEVR